jgi:hypothetical protein
MAIVRQPAEELSRVTGQIILAHLKSELVSIELDLFRTAIPMFFREKIAFWGQYIPKLLPSGNDHFDCGIPQVTLASPFYDYVSS